MESSGCSKREAKLMDFPCSYVIIEIKKLSQKFGNDARKHGNTA